MLTDNNQYIPIKCVNCTKITAHGNSDEAAIVVPTAHDYCASRSRWSAVLLITGPDCRSLLSSQEQKKCFVERIVSWPKHIISPLLVICPAPSHYLNQCWLTVCWTLGTNFSKILIKIQTFSLKKISSTKCWPFCPSLSLLTHLPLEPHVCVSE